MNFIEFVDKAMVEFSGFMWGPPIVVLLLGGGLFITAYCRFIPFRYIGQSIDILKGKFDKDEVIL